MQKDIRKAVLICGGIVVVCLITVVIYNCFSTRPHLAGIYQFVETRDGRESVWGVDIQLNRMSFRPVVNEDQIKIIDGKYGRDIKKLMTWSVSNDRKCLKIRFRPGMGDFGSGNGVTIHIDDSAFEPYPNISNRYEWSILTDIQ